MNTRSLPSWLLFGAALLGILALIAIVIVLVRPQGEGGGQAQVTPVATAGPIPSWIELYFTTPVGAGTPAPASGTPGRLDEHLVAALDGARQSIDMAIYDLELDNVVTALVRAQGRGVRVRLVTDTDNLNTDAMKKARAARIPIVPDDRGPIMHHKYVVLDNAAVWTGSWNFTPNDTNRYNNVAALIRSPELAANYSAEFEKMFTSKKFGPTKSKDMPNPRIQIGGVPVETIFESEGDAPTRIIERIREARTSIVFLAFTFTHDGIGQAIEDRYRAGVAVRGVQESLQSDRPESELGRFKKAGLDKEQPAGVPLPACTGGPGVLTDGNPQLMHEKVIVIDGRTVIFGSFNFTQNAATDNDENLLIIDDPAVAAAFQQEFCRVYNVAVAKAAKN